MIEYKWVGTLIGLYDIKEMMSRNNIVDVTNEFVLNRKTLGEMIQRNPNLSIDLNNLSIGIDNKYTLSVIADLYYTLTDGGFNVYNQCVNLFGNKYKLNINNEVQNGKILLLNSNKDIIYEFEEHH